ncbi:MAG TPA: substrate-binding domain-containing protein, partial [Geminicoccaceae bacterium]|nr:substrate-binding domain-containing protein [Geminicoccaceae bacterium]
MPDRFGRLSLTAAALALAAGAGLAAGPAAAQADRPLTVMTSLPNLAFPFFVHMQKELDAEADALGNIELMRADGQGSTPKQTADVEAAIVQGVDGIVISPNEVDAMA